MLTDERARGNECGVCVAHSKLRILVVDDVPDILASLGMLLEVLGHQPRTASSGRAAFAEIDQFDPHVVLLDIGLPDVSGYDIARKLRARHDRRQPYLVALTGRDTLREPRDAIAAGFNCYVLKPFDTRRLHGMIEDAERQLLVS